MRTKKYEDDKYTRMSDELRKRLHDLSTDHFCVYLFRYAEELTADEAAEILDLDVDSVLTISEEVDDLIEELTGTRPTARAWK